MTLCGSLLPLPRRSGGRDDKILFDFPCSAALCDGEHGGGRYAAGITDCFITATPVPTDKSFLLKEDLSVFIRIKQSTGTQSQSQNSISDVSFSFRGETGPPGLGAFFYSHEIRRTRLAADGWMESPPTAKIRMPQSEAGGRRGGGGPPTRSVSQSGKRRRGGALHSSP